MAAKFPKNLSDDITPSFSFGITLTSVIIILIVTTASLIGLISFRIGQQTAKELVKETQDSIQTRVEHDLNGFLGNPHALNQINAAAIRGGLMNPHDLVGLRAKFLHQIQAFDTVMTCAFGSEAGEFTSAGWHSQNTFDTAIADKSVDDGYRVYLLDEQGQPTELISEVQNYIPQERSWYQAALVANGPAWSPIYVWASQTNIGISAVLPVYNPDGDLAGVQLSALSLEHIGQFLSDIQTTKNGQIFIVEQSGLLVASSEAAPILREKPGGTGSMERVAATESTNPLIREIANFLARQFTSLEQIATRQSLEFEVNGRRYFLSVTPYADEYGLSWLIVSAIPESDLMGSVEANTQATILVSLIILAGALILGIVITQRITYPILQLNQAAQAMSHGNWKKIGNTSRLKEIRQLTGSFNQMAGQLSETVATLEQRVEARTSELTSVNQQLQVEIAERQKTEIERERLITELQTALDNVKMLSGLLPICSHCKKIQDDQGNWSDVAVYLRDHSEADFSHDICPECMSRYYPQIIGKMK